MAVSHGDGNEALLAAIIESTVISESEVSTRERENTGIDQATRSE